jgi:hypothetical protein
MIVVRGLRRHPCCNPRCRCQANGGGGRESYYPSHAASVAARRSRWQSTVELFTLLPVNVMIPGAFASYPTKRFAMYTQRLEHPRADALGGELLALPRTPAELEEAVRRSKAITTRRAALASAASLVPIPGLDIAVDIAAVMKLIPAINREFGLAPDQIELLSPGRQLLVYKSIVAIGGVMIGKLVTKEIAVEVLKTVGMRMSAKQVGKYVPVAGQALSVALGFGAMKYVGHQHIKDCRRVVEFTFAGGKI